MNFDYTEAEEYEADFESAGSIEFDEMDDLAGADASEVAQLINAVRAARAWH